MSVGLIEKAKSEQRFRLNNDSSLHETESFPGMQDF